MDEILRRDPVLESAIEHKDVDVIKRTLFDAEKGIDRVRDDACHESELWDYKSGVPDPARGAANDKAWADVAALVLAFHNNRGGVIVYGIHDKSYDAIPVKTRLDSKQFNEKLRRFISDRVTMLPEATRRPVVAGHVGLVRRRLHRTD
ncbi:MAG: RNA-binding domain-containing protein [Vulcanimicrobiaceae bacterium]